MQTIGIIIGCHTFCSIIEKALMYNDRIILSVSPEGIDEIKYSDFQQYLTNDDYRIKVCSVGDEKIKTEDKFNEQAWMGWSSDLFKIAGFDPNDADKEYTWYTHDLRCILVLKQIFPKHEFVLVNTVNFGGD